MQYCRLRCYLLAIHVGYNMFCFSPALSGWLWIIYVPVESTQGDYQLFVLVSSQLALSGCTVWSGFAFRDAGVQLIHFLRF